jgi:hypothetical protein
MRLKIVTINRLNFHDAVICGVEFKNLSKRENRVTLYLKIYPNNYSKKRIKAELIFKGIKEITTTFNLFELRKNRVAGNIDSLIIKKREFIFKIFGGEIVIKVGKQSRVKLKWKT